MALLDIFKGKKKEATMESPFPGPPPTRARPEMAMPPRPGMPAPPMPPMPTAPMPPRSEEVESTVNKIVGQKLMGFSQDMDKLVEWKGNVDAKLESTENKIDDLMKKVDAVEQAVLGKIGDYDRTLKTVGAELTAMQKIFQTTMPTFAENVRILSDVVEGSGGKMPIMPRPAANKPAEKKKGLPETHEIDISKLTPK